MQSLTAAIQTKSSIGDQGSCCQYCLSTAQHSETTEVTWSMHSMILQVAAALHAKFASSSDIHEATVYWPARWFHLQSHQTVHAELDDDIQQASVCWPGIAEAEMHVREVEARDSLQWLCQRLHNWSASHLFTVKNITGQDPTLCNQGILHNIQMNVHKNKLWYCYARNALYQLREHGTWENELQVLNEEDVHAFNEKSLTEELHNQECLRGLGLLDSTLEGTAGGSWSIAQLGEGCWQLSWIWYQLGSDDDGLTIHKGISIQTYIQGTYWSYL